jgi:hypothetical protein
MLNCGGAIIAIRVKHDQDWITIDDMVIPEQMLERCPSEVTEISIDLHGCGTFVSFSCMSPMKCTVDDVESPFSWGNNGKLLVQLPDFSGDLNDDLHHTVCFKFGNSS